MEIAAIQTLIQSFATHALGLTLGSPIVDTRELIPPCRRALAFEPQDDRPVWCAWKTDRGDIAVLGRYDEVQSAHVKAHVLLLEWWIGTEVHHEGWWHCYPKFPHDWIKGPGRVNRW